MGSVFEKLNIESQQEMVVLHAPESFAPELAKLTVITIDTERRSMQNIVRRLRPAQIEIYQAAHDQDLVEVPRRAQLDRENDGAALDLPELVRVDEAEG